MKNKKLNLRANPKPKVRGAYFVNPETDDILWYHGSSSPYPLSLDMDFEDSDHMAFFLTSNQRYADMYAEIDWSGNESEYESVYALRVKECNILSLDDLVGRDGKLNDEGIKLAIQIQKSESDWSLDQIVSGLIAVSESMDWQHFIDVDYYDNTLGEALPLYSLPVAIEELGYDGWVERRTTGQVRSNTDLAIFSSALNYVELVKTVYTTI